MNSKVENQDLLINCCFEEAATYGNSKPQKFLIPCDFSVWIWSSLKHNLFLSESFCRMVGIPKGTIPSFELLVESIYPKDVEQFLKIADMMLKGIRPKDFTFRVCLSNKSVRRIYCIIGFVATEWKGVYDVVGVCYQLDN